MIRAIMNRKHNITIIALFIFGTFLFPTSPVHAQRVDMVRFTTLVNKGVEKAVFKALEDKIQEYKDYHFHMPYLQYAFIDLNFDGKNEVIARFQGDYIFIDRHGNTDTYFFAQTSKGLLPILEEQTSKIGLGRANAGGLRDIYIYKKPNIKQPLIYKWDGKKKYIKE